MATARRRRALASGFSLVEMLTAVALGTLVLVLLFAAQGAMQRVLGRRDTSPAREEARLTGWLDEMARDLESVVAPEASGDRVLTLALSDDGVHLEMRTAHVPPGTADPRRASLRRVAYRASPDGRVGRLDAAWPAAPDAPEPLFRPWAEDLTAFQVEVFHDGDWHTAWPPAATGTALPLRARIRLAARGATAGEIEVWIPVAHAWKPTPP